MNYRVLTGLFLGWLALACHAADVVEMDVGEIKILDVKPVERVAVGNAGVISTSLLNNGQLLAIAEKVGVSTLHIWYKNGEEADMEIQVGTKDVMKLRQERGITQRAEEVRDLLSDIPGVSVRVVGKHIVLSGLVDKSYEDVINTVRGAFTEILDLTRKEELNLPSEKMVLMDVIISQFSKDYIEKLGIDWDRVVAGPSAAVAYDAKGNDIFRAATGAAVSFSSALPTHMDPAQGYFGIVSEITSRINFAVDQGYGLILAQPKLAARSGGAAHFLSGGEVPLVSTSVNGSTVEYKEFGISLDVEPTIDHNDLIHAKVETEVTAITGSGAGGNPIFDSKKTSADLSLREGETIVISGLIDDNMREGVKKIKGLGNIPILGAFFRNNEINATRRELVIFVTPSIHDSNSPRNRELLELQRSDIRKFRSSVKSEQILEILE